MILHAPDPTWPDIFHREAAQITFILGQRALSVEHVGSTSVPGLSAKPIIDMLLVVADPAQEADYVSALEAHGYVLRIREPDWHDHRLLKGPDANINLHVFRPGCPEIQRMLQFRDWLRTHDDDRRRYQETKQQLAAQDWAYVQNYADAKSAIVEEILARAGRAST
ncbi:MAG TPA: GrpB family protein [Candidatus Dormibacteraeota bacterium]|nr:GrpB family protein [Candidatus Dormibacteraeota bacterium]